MVSRRAILAAAAAASLPGSRLRAETGWPGGRPIRLVVSYPPGGPADILARTVAQRLAAALEGGAQVIVENRPGANGNIGAAAAARAQPDGHTLFMLTSSHCANMTLYREPGYDAVRDFAPITNIASYPLLLVAHPSTGFRDLAGLLAAARAEPGRITFASAGSGGGAHLAAELFATMAGVRMTHVPYTGTGPALLGVVAGHVATMFAGVSAALPHVEAGRLVALGVTGTGRLARLPDLPTIAESGLPGYAVTSWLGLVAPAGTPPAILARLNDAMRRVAAQPDLRAQMDLDGAVVEVTPPAPFGAYIAEEVARWAKVIRDSGAKLD